MNHLGSERPTEPNWTPVGLLYRLAWLALGYWVASAVVHLLNHLRTL